MAKSENNTKITTQIPLLLIFVIRHPNPFPDLLHFIPFSHANIFKGHTNDDEFGQSWPLIIAPYGFFRKFASNILLVPSFPFAPSLLHLFILLSSLSLSSIFFIPVHSLLSFTLWPFFIPPSRFFPPLSASL